MNAETWRQIQELFDRILDTPPDQRAQLLEDADISPVVLARVESMLRHADDEPDFSNTPASKLAEAIQSAIQDFAHAPLQPGVTVGRYEIIRLIASGGMGDVYLAHSRDGDLQIPVALKIARQPHGEDAEAITRSSNRFDLECQVLLNLDHPAIPKIIDTGTTHSGLTYFVMEYVDGKSIDRYCKINKLSNRDRASLICDVCDALHHAHQRLVIHRDLKPANIFVRQDGLPKVLDFGIASEIDQHADRTRLTKTGEFIGTLAYASPEQLDGKSTPDTRADVYALGVVLYELLTESLPHAQTTSLPVLLDQIRTNRPPTPASINQEIDADLSAVVMRAIAREPDRRYQSISEFGADLRNFLEARPVNARADSRWYVVRSEIKLRRVPIVTALLILAASLAFGLYATAQSRLLEKRNAELTDALSRESVERAGLLAQTGSLVGAERLLWPLYLEGSDRATWALRDLYTRFPVRGSIQLNSEPSFACVLDEWAILVGDRSIGDVQRVDLDTSRTQRLPVFDGAMSMSSANGTVVWVDRDGVIRTSSVEDPDSQFISNQAELPSKDTRIGLFGSTILPWILSDGTLSVFSKEKNSWNKISIREGVTALDVSVTKSAFIVLCSDLTIRMFNWEGEQLRSIPSAPIGRSRAKITASQSNQYIAQVTDSRISVFTLGQQDPTLFDGANGWIEAVCVLSDDRNPDLLVSCSADNLLRVWRLDTTELLLECNAFDSTPTHVLPVPNTHVFITIEESGFLRKWDLTNLVTSRVTRSDQQTGLDLEVDPRNKIVATGVDGIPHRFTLMDQATHQVLASMEWNAPICAIEPGVTAGSWFVADYQGGVAKIVQSAEGLSLDWRISLPQRPNAVALSSSGKSLAIACDQGTVEFLDPENGSSSSRVRLDAIRVPSMSWHPARDFLAVCTYPESDLISIRDTLGSPRVSTLVNGSSQFGARTVTFNPNGKEIAMSGDDSLIRVWNLNESHQANLVKTLSGHNEGLFSLDFSPSGKLLVSAGRSGRVLVWDTKSSEPLARIDASDRMLFSAKFSDTERAVFTIGIGNQLYEWNLDLLDQSIARNLPDRGRTTSD